MKVIAKKSSIHGFGLFSAAPIEVGEFIGEFEGKEVNHDDIHVLWYEEDGEWRGLEVDNVLKYANHSLSPNVEVLGREMYAIKPIDVDEEITFHYGEDWDA